VAVFGTDAPASIVASTAYSTNSPARSNSDDDQLDIELGVVVNLIAEQLAAEAAQHVTAAVPAPTATVDGSVDDISEDSADASQDADLLNRRGLNLRVIHAAIADMFKKQKKPHPGGKHLGRRSKDNEDPKPLHDYGGEEPYQDAHCGDEERVYYGNPEDVTEE
jgi:hypothetical protein